MIPFVGLPYMNQWVTKHEVNFRYLSFCVYDTLTTMTELTQSLLKSLYHYDPGTGIFTRVITINGGGKAGSEAGYIDSTGSGYHRIAINGYPYYTHRLAFLFMTGSMPYREVDHINHNRTDNRWSNLRCATKRENTRNVKMKINNTSGITGVTWSKGTNKWRAQIQAGNKYIHLGCFTNIEDAAKARKAAEQNNGFHANHGL